MAQKSEQGHNIINVYNSTDINGGRDSVFRKTIFGLLVDIIIFTLNDNNTNSRIFDRLFLVGPEQHFLYFRVRG